MNQICLTVAIFQSYLNRKLNIGLLTQNSLSWTWFKFLIKSLPHHPHYSLCYELPGRVSMLMGFGKIHVTWTLKIQHSWVKSIISYCRHRLCIVYLIAHSLGELQFGPSHSVTRWFVLAKQSKRQILWFCPFGPGRFIPNTSLSVNLVYGGALYGQHETKLPPSLLAS